MGAGVSKQCKSSNRSKSYSNYRQRSNYNSNNGGFGVSLASEEAVTNQNNPDQGHNSSNTFNKQPYHSSRIPNNIEPERRSSSNCNWVPLHTSGRGRQSRPTVASSFSSASVSLNIIDTNNNRCSSTEPTNTSNTMPCTSCMAQFTLFNKKWRCEKCLLLFCEACLIPVESTGASNALTSSTMCQACFVFLGPVLLRSQLMRLKVRDLMRHVRAKGINNTRGCLTKAEVVDLLATVPTITLLMDDLNINEERPRHANERLAPGDDVVNSNSPSPNTEARPDPSPNRSDNSTSDQFNIGSSQNETDPPAEAPRERKQLRSIENEDDIDKLTVRELKEILVNNFVIIKGLCEKEELVQKAKMLWRQEIGQRKTAKQKDLDEDGLLPGEDSCRICMDAPINCVLLECGHMVSCVVCGKQLSECPVCRQYVVRAVHTFRT